MLLSEFRERESERVTYEMIKEYGRRLGYWVFVTVKFYNLRSNIIIKSRILLNFGSNLFGLAKVCYPSHHKTDHS